jgi:proteic killer suppression protein
MEKCASKTGFIGFYCQIRRIKLPPANRLESLSGDRNGQHSIRINDQYRICFIFTNDGIEQVEIVDYHK